MKVTVTPIIIGSFGMVHKGLIRVLEEVEHGGRAETIQTKALLRSASLLRRLLET